MSISVRRPANQPNVGTFRAASALRMGFQPRLPWSSLAAPAIALSRWHPLRRWRLLSLALIGLSTPGALGQTLTAMGAHTSGVNDGSCRTMALPVVYVITLAVALGAFFGLVLVKQRLGKEGWSLANALSEPTRLTIPVEWRWTESAGDQLTVGSSAARKELRAPDGTPMAVTLLEASSSRMIATLGGLSILMLYMGFGTFALYSFGLTCQLPSSMGAVTTFLLSGLSLFAPYVANKVSTAIQPNIRSGSQGDLAAAAEAPPAPSDARSALAGQAPVGPRPDAKPARTADPATSQAATRATQLAPQPQTQATATGVALHQAAPAFRSPQVAPPPVAASAAYGPALALIREFEGFVAHAYPDPATGAEPWTIGYGFTSLDGRSVQPGETISLAQAEAELQRQAQACANHLAATVPYWQEMTNNQHCALLDFAWNLGAGFYGDEANFASISRDLKNHDWEQVPQTLLLYCDPGTAVQAGLLRRRKAEAALWQTPDAAPAAAPGSPNPDRSTAASSSHAAAPSRFSNPLKVPYCDQLLMADGQGWRECFSASSAMLAMYWGKEPNENVYDTVRARYGDSTSSEAQLEALRALGLQANFQTDGTTAMLQQEIDAGRPVAVGWLCDGPVSAPSGGGHWSVIIGYDATGVFINDPYGNCELVNGGYLSHHDGAGLHYSFQNWLPRWRVGGSGGWMLTCRP